MKRMGRLIGGAAALLVLLLGGYFCLKPAKARYRVPTSAGPMQVATTTSDRLKPALHTNNTPIVDFASWTEKFLVGDKEAAVADGEELAKARLAEMYELIKR